jgi:hypothetical protein
MLSGFIAFALIEGHPQSDDASEIKTRKKVDWIRAKARSTR